jgi:hypothetical protein
MEMEDRGLTVSGSQILRDRAHRLAALSAASTPENSIDGRHAA